MKLSRKLIATWETFWARKAGRTRRLSATAGPSSFGPRTPTSTTIWAGHSPPGVSSAQPSRVFEKRSASSPLLPKPITISAERLQERGRLADAASCFRQAVRLRPEYAEAHNELGVVLQMLDKPDESATCFREALRQSPDSPDTHYRQGLVLESLGELSAAEASFCEALSVGSRARRRTR